MVQKRSCCFDCFLKKKYCSYYAMCDVIFPVDYPDRTNMFTEFELKQIKYLQRSALQILFSLQISKIRNCFEKTSWKYQERKEIRAVPQIIKTIWYSRYLTSTSPLFLPSVKQGCILTVSKSSKTIFSAYGCLCIRIPIENFCVIKSITLSFWHFTIRGIIRNDPMLQGFICKAVHNIELSAMTFDNSGNKPTC